MSGNLPRKMTAIGVAGPVGQSFAVYEKNWKCYGCQQENYASSNKCVKCKKQRPRNNYRNNHNKNHNRKNSNNNNHNNKSSSSSSSSIVQDPALLAIQQGQMIAWQEVVDPNSNQIYYYNRLTGVTQWERPVELGPAPHATGWYGRGQAGSRAAQLFAEENLKYLSRPAKQQKEFIDTNDYHVEGANEFNIWYGRYNGQRDRGKHKIAASNRCKLAVDAGKTKADERSAAGNAAKIYFCLPFAHGACMKGSECKYYHRVPLPEDDRNTDELYDCFGRQRHKSHREDMGGVGSFMQPCRTLYVGGILQEKYKNNEELEEACWRHFGEWGELENINIVHRLSVAFPRYRLRTSAEFAKEAMAQQSLEHGEILNIRWAHDDPNPVAKEAIERANLDAVYSILQSRGINMNEAKGFVAPVDYHYQIPDTTQPGSKRLRIENNNDGNSSSSHVAQAIFADPALAYPDTSSQFTEKQHKAAALVQEREQQQQQQPEPGPQPQPQPPEPDSSQLQQSQMPTTQRYTQEQMQYMQQMQQMQYMQYMQHMQYMQYMQHTGGGITYTATTVPSQASIQDLNPAIPSSAPTWTTVEEVVVEDEVGEEESTKKDDGSFDEHKMNDNHKGSSSEEDNSEDNDEEVACKPDGEGWEQYEDPTTGATYFYNHITGESSWGVAPTAPSSQPLNNQIDTQTDAIADAIGDAIA